MPQQNPFGGNAALAGPSPDVFQLLTADNQGVALVSGTLPGSPALRKELRFLQCLATGATLVLQSRGGGVFAVPFAVGDVFDLAYVVAVTGIPDNTSFIGGV